MQDAARQIRLYVHDVLNEPLRRFRFSILLLVLLLVGGTVGYVAIEGMGLIDAFYMTVITLATVGFGEVHPLSQLGRLYTTAFIIIGVGAGAWAITNGIEVLFGESVWVSMQRRRMDRLLMDLQNHYIVCGFGRMGRQIVRDLVNRNEPFVVIERDPRVEDTLIAEGYPYLMGDAEDDAVLRRAGVARARGIVAALNSDAANVLTVLTSREFNPNILVVARAASESSEAKLRRAGADRVVNPDAIGGHRLALALLQPKVHDFMSKIFNIEEMEVDIGEVIVLQGAEIAGRTIAETNIRNRWNLTILAMQTPTGEFIISPDARRIIEPGETLILIGGLGDIQKFSRWVAGGGGR